LDGVVEAVAELSAVGEDLVVFQAADDMFHAGAGGAWWWAALWSFSPGSRAGPGRFRCGTAMP
jgi:hypothetical protein